MLPIKQNFQRERNSQGKTSSESVPDSSQMESCEEQEGFIEISASEYAKLKHQVHQYQYTLETQQEQMRQYYDLQSKHETFQGNYQLLLKEVQTLREWGSSSGQDSVMMDGDSHSPGFIRTVDPPQEGPYRSYLNATQERELVDQVMHLTLELAQARSQLDYQELQLGAVTTERDCLLKEVASKEETISRFQSCCQNNRDSNSRNALLNRLTKSTSNLFRMKDEIRSLK